MIDLSSPQDGEAGTGRGWGGVSILDTDTGEAGEEQLADLSFTDIALRRAELPILAALPSHAATLPIGDWQ